MNKRFENFLIIVLIVINVLIIGYTIQTNDYTLQEVAYKNISLDKKNMNTTYSVAYMKDSDIVDINTNYYAIISLEEDAKTYSMNLKVNFYNDSSDEWDRVYFRDYPSQFKTEKFGGVSEITNIQNNISGKSLEYKRETDETVFYIILDKPAKPGEFISIDMEYTAHIPLLNARYGHQLVGGDEYNKDFYLANCIPVLCPYENGEFKYYPYYDEGECFYSKMANYDVTLYVSKEYTVIATGNVVDETEADTYKTIRYSAYGVRDFAIMVGNTYKKTSDVVDGINIDVYYHGTSSGDAQKALDLTKTYMKLNNRRFGKYPYNTFSVVECQMDMLGMEYPQMCLITMDDGSQWIEHEMIHQWFYNLVGSNNYTDPWIDEAITTYLTSAWAYGGEEIITKSIGEINDDDLYHHLFYECGPSLYFDLEEKYGMKSINLFLRDLLRKYAYKEVSAREYVKLLQEHFKDSDSILEKYIDKKYLSD